MAIVKYGAVVTEIKGPVGGQVFQGGRSAPTLRTKPPSGINTAVGNPIITGVPNPLATNQRLFSTIQKTWQGLTQVQRDSWAGLVGIYTFTDKFGDVYNGTPFQIFSSMNLIAVAIDEAIITTAPVELASVSPLGTTDDYSISGTWNTTTTQAGGIGMKIPLWVSRPVSATTPFSRAKLIKVGVGTYAGPGTTDFKPAYDALVGPATVIGSVIYATGYTSEPSYPRKQFEVVTKSTVIA